MSTDTITRRAFLGLIGQVGAYIFLAQNRYLGNMPTPRSTGSRSAYGQGSYNRGRYPGFRLNFPFIRKGVFSHGPSAHPQQ